jgi:hypothetical protein
MLPIGCRAEGLRRDRCHVGCDRETCPTVIQTTALIWIAPCLGELEV